MFKLNVQVITQHIDGTEGLATLHTLPENTPFFLRLKTGRYFDRGDDGVYRERGKPADCGECGRVIIVAMGTPDGDGRCFACTSGVRRRPA